MMRTKLLTFTLALFLLFRSATAGLARENELVFGFNPDYGLLVGAEIDLEQVVQAPCWGSFEAYPANYNLFFTAYFPWQEKLGFYARAGLAENIYLGLGTRFLLSWDLHLFAGFGQALNGDSFLDLLAAYRLSDNLSLKVRYHMYQAYLGIGYKL